MAAAVQDLLHAGARRYRQPRAFGAPGQKQANQAHMRMQVRTYPLASTASEARSMSCASGQGADRKGWAVESSWCRQLVAWLRATDAEGMLHLGLSRLQLLRKQTNTGTLANGHTHLPIVLV